MVKVRRLASVVNSGSGLVAAGGGEAGAILDDAALRSASLRSASLRSS